MGKVIAYISDERRCFCQLKLDSGERILISIAQSIKIMKLAFGGTIPIKTIWGTDNPGREIMQLYPEQSKQVRSSTDILNLFKDDLIRCKSIAEVKERLS